MLTLSVKAVYGICAIVELALHYEKGPIQIKDIAEAHDIPRHYLEQLLVIMKKAGIVKSFRGAQGGYILGRSPSEIKAGEIFESLDGALSIVPNQKRNNALSFFWVDLESDIRSKLDVTIEELLLQKQQQEGHFIYNI